MVKTLALEREVLLKGKAKYNLLPFTNKFRSALFNIENITYFFNLTNYFNEEVIFPEPSPSDRP
jgi:hypothetical protein